MSPLSNEDSQFLAYLRSLSILVIVFGHIGLFWSFKPYSEFLHVFVPIFFFISGAVSYGSFCRSENLVTYYKKRSFGLLIPYYLLVLVQFLTYIRVHKGVGTLSFSDVIRWAFIIPHNEIMPFSIGHVWFLHTLFVLILVSPFYFYLFKRNNNSLLLIITFSLFLSFVQMFVDVSGKMMLLHNDLFKPAVHSCFFLFGVLVFYTNYFVARRNIIFLLISSILISVVVARCLSINIDYDFHTYAPDLFYVAGSFTAIAIMLLIKQLLVKLIQTLCLKSIFSFLHRQTYSIYLVHVPVLKLWHYFLSFYGWSGNKCLAYGISKMCFVIIGTFLFAVPFTYLSSLAKKKVENIFTSSKE